MGSAKQADADLAGAIAVLKLLADQVDETMPLRMALVFLRVAQASQRAEQLDMRELGKELGITSDLMSRDVGELADYSRSRGREGHRLIEVLIDLQDRRRRRLILSPKGRKLLESLSTRKS